MVLFILHVGEVRERVVHPYEELVREGSVASVVASCTVVSLYVQRS